MATQTGRRDWRKPAVRTPARQLFTALVYPGENTEQWIAHCLELDVVTQGESPRDAVRMLGDALETVARANLGGGNPFLWELRPAPADVWRRLDGAVPLGVTTLKPLRPPGGASSRWPAVSTEIVAWSVPTTERARARKAR